MVFSLIVTSQKSQFTSVFTQFKIHLYTPQPPPSLSLSLSSFAGSQNDATSISAASYQAMPLLRWGHKSTQKAARPPPPPASLHAAEGLTNQPEITFSLSPTSCHISYQQEPLWKVWWEMESLSLWHKLCQHPHGDSFSHPPFCPRRAWNAFQVSYKVIHAVPITFPGIEHPIIRWPPILRGWGIPEYLHCIRDPVRASLVPLPLCLKRSISLWITSCCRLVCLLCPLWIVWDYHYLVGSSYPRWKGYFGKCT